MQSMNPKEVESLAYTYPDPSKRVSREVFSDLGFNCFSNRFARSESETAQPFWFFQETKKDRLREVLFSRLAIA